MLAVGLRPARASAMNASLTVRTCSPEQTRALGREVGRRLWLGAVIGLEGDLGAGKTCFVKGLAGGLGLDGEEIASPTFTLIAEHYREGAALFHIDLYRLEGLGAEDMEELGLEEYLLVSIRFGPADARVITLTAYGGPYQGVIRQLGAHLSC